MPDYIPIVFERHPVEAGEAVITGRFGDWYELQNRGRYQHRGVDYGVPVGTPVLAPAAGTVVEPVNDGSFGIMICIDHPRTPWYSGLAHLSEARVRPGDVVAAGQLVGMSGNSGFTTGPHLHWQLSRNRPDFPADITLSADPLQFLRGAPQLPAEPLAGILNAILVERMAVQAAGHRLILAGLDESVPAMRAALERARKAGLI
jgi:murein DD-endopeptidase MepM/ murein hydrolase activator NlpD